MKPHLICYDISKNNLRTRLGNKILEYGLDRINLSVYLGAISESSLTELENWLSQEIQAKADPDDSVIVLPLSTTQVHDMRVYGRNDLDRKALTGEQHTLLL